MRYAAALLLWGAVATPSAAHEFWIDPASAPAPGGTASAELRVGQDLKGETLSYLPTVVASMRHHPPEGPARDIAARIGDLPAIDGVAMEADGLHLLTVETMPAYIVFEDMPEFVDYLAYEGWAGLEAAHRARGLPEVEIAEEYLRHARALVQVGAPQPAHVDRPAGLVLELVFDGSPFLPDVDTLPVTLIWQGAPLGDRQVSVFHRAPDGTVERSTAPTDGEGRVEIALDGPGDYLLNAVEIEPAEGPGSVVWQSHWASLAFTLP